MRIILVIQVVVAATLTGIIWFVQFAHYPLFAFVAAADFPRYVAEHVVRARLVVTLPILADLGIAALLSVGQVPGVSRWSRWTGLLVAAAIGAVSLAVHVPLYERMKAGYDPAAIETLVMTNWFRAIGWSARLVLALYMLAGFDRFTGNSWTRPPS